VPSGQNQESKRKLLKDEGVLFDENGYLIDKKVLWDEFNVEKGSAAGKRIEGRWRLVGQRSGATSQLSKSSG
jgi:hypothetical protein